MSSLFVRQQGRPFIAIPNNDDLVALKELIEAGKVTPVIDRTYPLSETPEAKSSLLCEELCQPAFPRMGVHELIHVI